MHIRMRALVGDDVLAGALRGRQAMVSLFEKLKREPQQPEPLYLDFIGIEVATASFLRECIVDFRNVVRKRWTSYYPVVANANDTVTEELSILLEPHRDVLVLCTLNENGIPAAPRLLGALDPKQRITFDLVKELGEADAGELMRAANKIEEVGRTAWNNRLASLSKLGLLMEMSHGRVKRYRPLPLGE